MQKDACPGKRRLQPKPEEKTNEINHLNKNVMKKLLNVMKTLLPVAAIMLSMASCKEEDPAKEATIAIKVTATSQSSVSFELTATDAKSVSYAVAEAAQIESATYETIDEVGTSPIAVTKDGLAENAEYVIRAYATNADGKKSTTAEETFMTTSAPSIDIEVIEVTSSEVIFFSVSIQL